MGGGACHRKQCLAISRGGGYIKACLNLISYTLIKLTTTSTSPTSDKGFCYDSYSNETKMKWNLNIIGCIFNQKCNANIIEIKTKSSQCIDVVHNIDEYCSQIVNIDENEMHWIRKLVSCTMLMHIVQNIDENEMH